MKRRNALPIGDFILAAFQKDLTPEAREKFQEFSAEHIWQDVLGATIADYTTDFSFKNGVVSVRVLSPALRNDLFMQRSRLIEKLNEKSQFIHFKSIMFR